MQNSHEREMALTDLIRGIAQIEAALADILQAEGKRLSSFFDGEERREDECIHCCETSSDLLNNIYKIETQLQRRLELFFAER